MADHPAASSSSATVAPGGVGQAQTNVLSAQGVRRRYAEREILAGVDLSLAPGSVLGLVGRNGAGKSTFLRCLLGLSPRDGGAITIFGVEAMALGPAQKERIGYTAQQPRLQAWLTAPEVIEYVSAFYQRWDHALVKRLLAAWEIPLRQRVGTLSPGEQSRLSILLALGHRPDLLILDEPAASLDPAARRAVMGAVLEAVAEDGASVLLSSHIISDLERVADRVAVLGHGRILVDTELSQLKDSVKRLRVQALGLPRPLQVPGLVSCVERPDGAILTLRAEPADIARVVADLTQRHGATVVVEDLGLEDIVLEIDR